MKSGRKPITYLGKEPIFYPNAIPLNELIQIQRAKVEDLDFSSEPRVSVSWSESDQLLPVAVGDIKDNFTYALAKNAEQCGFTKLRTVQQAILPYFNYGCNLCLASGACSGKTIGYLLPLIQKVIDDLRVEPHKSYHPRAVIVVSTREKGKDVFNTMRMLTIGLDVKICVSLLGMDESHYIERDKSDIIIMSHRTLYMTLLENRFTLALLKILVIEGADDMHSDVHSGNGVVWLREILKYYDAQSNNAHRQLITVAEDISFLDSVFCKDRVFHADNTVVIDNGNLRLSPSNHLLLRVNNNTMTRAVLELIQNYEQGKTIVIYDRRENSVEKKVQEVLESVGISYFNYHSLFDIAKRTEIQHRVALGERQVLIIHHCNQLRSLRFPGVRQIIHIGRPSNGGELYEASYNYSSGGIAYNRRARSVVLCNIQNKQHKVARVAEVIQNAPVVEGWPKNHVPQWAVDYINGKQVWTEEDAKAAEELWDLPVETVLVSSQEKYQAQQQYDTYDDRGYGYPQKMEQNWDYGRNPTNSSLVSSAPSEDTYCSYNQPQIHSQYSSPPPPRQPEAKTQVTGGNSVGNGGRSVNQQEDSRQGGSRRFEYPDEVPEYDDFEEENIGYREFTKSGLSRGGGTDRRTSSSSSYYDHQEPYYQDEYQDRRRDSRSQDPEQYYDYSSSRSSYGYSDNSREYYGQNRSNQNDFLPHQTTQRPKCEDPQMGQRQGSCSGRQEVYQNWETARREPESQQQKKQDFQQSWSQRDRSGPCNQEEAQDNRNRQFSDDRRENRYSDSRPPQFPKPAGSWENDQEPSPRDQSFQSNNWQQDRDQQRGNRFSGGNGRGQRNRFAPANRGKPGYYRTSSSQGQPTGSWDDDSNLPKDLWPQHPNKCIPGQRPSSEAGQQNSWDDKIDSSEEEKAEPKWSEWRVSSRKSVDIAKDTPIMGGASGSEEGQRKMDGNQ